MIKQSMLLCYGVLFLLVKTLVILAIRQCVLLLSGLVVSVL